MPNKDDMDSFWDIKKLVPTKKTTALPSFSTKEKTVTHTVSGDFDADSERRKLTLTEKQIEGATPERVYLREGGLIRSVTVKHVPDKFDFHANFKKAAELYFDFVGTEAPFAPFYSFMPQYTQLSQSQKNFYFYWRTMLRRGRYIKTDYSYFYLYVYEILNLPELIKPAEGLSLLVYAWKNYRKDLPNIDSNMALWVQDYCLVYNLPAPIEEIGDFIFDIMSVTRFKEFYFSSYESLGSEGVGALIAYLSDYDWRKGKYAGGESKDAYRKHLMGAMGLLIHEMLESDAIGIRGDAVSQKTDNAFRMALTTSSVKYRVTVKYRPISEETEVREIVTSALKYTENKLRSLMSVKSRLAVKGLDERYSKVIDSYFAELFEKVNRERMRANRPEYEKLYEAETEQLSALDAEEIERVSWQTTARLIVEDEIEGIATEPYYEPERTAKEETSSAEKECEDYGLSDKEIEFLTLAYNGEFIKMRELSAAEGTLPEAMADRINEAFCDNFGDIVLSDEGEGFTVISDYREDIKQWLTKIAK